MRVSLWVLMAVGLATGYLAGTIGVGGFIGVPCMIYVFGVPTAVAAGTELYLAVYMGGFGALNYALKGFVDIRMTMLLYLGSLIGIYVGVYGTKVVKEILIRIVTGVVILLCVVSRAVAVPAYLRQLGWLDIDPAWDGWFNGASKVMLFAAGLSGCSLIVFHVIKSYRQRLRVQHTPRWRARDTELSSRPGRRTIMSDLKKKIEDWMVRVSFAEADAARRATSSRAWSWTTRPAWPWTGCASCGTSARRAAQTEEA